MKNNSVSAEVLRVKLDLEGKTGVGIPLTIDEFTNHKAFMDGLLSKNLISKKAAKEWINEKLAITLDDETYDSFVNCVTRKRNEKIKV